MGTGLKAKYDEIWVLEQCWWVPGIAPPQPTQSPYPGYTSPTRTMPKVYMLPAVHGQYPGVNMVMGLISVAQLSLSD